MKFRKRKACPERSSKPGLGPKVHKAIWVKSVATNVTLPETSVTKNRVIMTVWTFSRVFCIGINIIPFLIGGFLFLIKLQSRRFF